MTMAPRLRKLILTAHIATSVGWLGSVAAYLALDVAATAGQDVQTVRSAYLAMETIAWSVIIPLALASLIVGIVNALGTQWGLFRHYWVLVKLALTVVATAVLLIETRIVSDLARAAMSSADPRVLPGTLPHSVGGLIVLLLIMILSVYKPRGVTPYGWRKQRDQRRKHQGQRTVLAP